MEKMLPLREIYSSPVLVDANIFMVGIQERASNPDYSFERIKDLILMPLLETFSKLFIHEAVYDELDDESKELVDEYERKGTVRLVGEGNLYGNDPKYTEIFNTVADNSLAPYKRGQSKNKGEIYSLTYALYYGIPVFCSKDALVDNIKDDFAHIQCVRILTFDYILFTAYIYHLKQNSKNGYKKSIKAMYKKDCADVIKRHHLPSTFAEYVNLFL